MPIRTFAEWSQGKRCLSTFPLSSLKDATIGIDASYYLDVHIHHEPSKEPLLTALGGFPFGLKFYIEKELQCLKELAVNVFFVFPGLEFGKKEYFYEPQTAEAMNNDSAWEKYDQTYGAGVVEAFRKEAGMDNIPRNVKQYLIDLVVTAGSVKTDYLHRFLQRILLQQKVDFIVAPYSASAQLAYLDNHPSHFIDAVMGHDELLLFDVDKIITRFDFEQSQFTWLSRKLCQDDLGRVAREKFVDGCLMLGSPFLPTFPPLESRSKAFSLNDAIGTLNTLGGSVATVCSHYHDDERVNKLQYSDRYKRAIMTLRHHVILTFDGKVAPMNPDTAPSDVHDLIGQRLPEEFYFYLSRGVVGPQIANWLTSDEIQMIPPFGTGNDPDYRRLMRDQLTPIRTQSLSLLSEFLHRFYHNKVIKLRLWFDAGGDTAINLKDVPPIKDSFSSWYIKQDSIQALSSKAQEGPSSLRFALTALGDPEFPSSSSRDTTNPLSTKDEILSNTIWRFLQLRQFVGADHKLTNWGKCLASAMASLDSSDGHDDSLFIAVEMMRMGLLNSKSFFLNLSGGPLWGKEEERPLRLLISRVACIAKLRHKPIGFSGPLSRQLLAFQAVISAVRSSLRDLIEMCLTGLLLNGDASRDRTDWAEMSLSLPFIDDNDCGLAIAVKTYFDELCLQKADQTDPEVKKQMKDKNQGYFQHVESFEENLNVAFKLWDAVYSVSQGMGKEFKDGQMWKDVNTWLEPRK